MDELGQKLGYTKENYEGWYTMTNKKIVELGGGGVVGYYGGSISKMLRAVYPEIPWDDAKFPRRPHGFWASSDNRRANLWEIGKKLGIAENEYEKWYNVRNADFNKAGGSGLLSIYNFSMFALLKDVLPEYPWDRLKFPIRPANYWKSQENVRKFMLEVGEKLKISKDDLSGWYKMTNKDVVRHGGSRPLTIHDTSLSKLLQFAFPEHNWELSRFQFTPRNLWSSPAEVRGVLDEIGLKLGIKPGDYEAWYGVTTNDLLSNGGTGILNSRQNSPKALLEFAFPEHNWDPNRFVKRPQNYWASPENLREFMDEVGVKLGIQKGEYEKWYKVTKAMLMKNNAGRALGYHKCSPSSLLRSVYPEYPWRRWRFNNVRGISKLPKEFFQEMLSDLEKDLGLKSPEEWANVSSVRLSDLNEKYGLPKNRSVQVAINHVYPEIMERILEAELRRDKAK